MSRTKSAPHPRACGRSLPGALVDKSKKINPYVDNRIQYSSILDATQRNTRGWRIVTYMAAVICVISTIGVVYIGSRSKIQPMVVVINDEGIPTRLYPVTEKTMMSDNRITMAAIAMTLNGLRGVTLDNMYQQRQLENLAYFFSNGTPGYQKVQDMLHDSEKNPFERSKSELVYIKIKNIIRLTAQTWQVEWKEETRDITGQFINNEGFKGTFTVGEALKLSQAALYVNPTGIVIEDYEISKIMK